MIDDALLLYRIRLNILIRKLLQGLVSTTMMYSRLHKHRLNIHLLGLGQVVIYMRKKCQYIILFAYDVSRL